MPDAPVTEQGQTREDRFDKSEHAVLAKTWQRLIRAGIKHRKSFTEGYEIAKKFAYGDHEFMYEDSVPDAPFKATVPKVWEMINIFGPMMAFRNPHRNVNNRFDQGDPLKMGFGKVLQNLLNYSVHELHLNREMRECVDESMVGAGVMWLEKDSFSGLWGHFHDTPLNLIIDPDAETLQDAWWIARKKMMPRWEFAGLVDAKMDDEDLPAAARPAIVDTVDTEVKRQGDEEKYPAGKTNEILCVYEVWSKMGMGWRSFGVPPEQAERARKEIEDAKADPDIDFRHFYVLQGSHRIWAVGPWPVPLWADNDWPLEMLYYRKKADYVWPVPLLVPSLGLQKAINWIMMFLWTHMKTASRQFIAAPSDLDETIRDRIVNGVDLELLTVNAADLGEKRVSDLIGFLQHPEMNTDLWRYLDLARQMFEESTGLYPALYAQSGGAEPRSATADQNRQMRAELRPDDMREVVEQLHSRMARKEAIAYLLDEEFGSESVGDLLGPEAAEIWKEYSETGYQEGGIEKVMREYDYRIEAGSTAKPNLQTDRDNAKEIFDRFMQVAGGLGDIEAINRMAYNLQRSMGIKEQDMVQFNPPPPPDEGQDPAAEGKARESEAKADLAEEKVATERFKRAMEAEVGQMQGGNGTPPEEGEVVAIEGGKPVRA